MDNTGGGIGMNHLYRKNETGFALLWIFIYITGTSFAEALSEITGVFKLFPALIHVAMAGFLFIWLKRNGLSEKFGLFLPRYRLILAWFFLPLALIALYPLFFRPAVRYSPSDTVMFVISMLCAGMLEEIIFRGFLFKAAEKTGLTRAIVVSSVTFGIGHIVNLFSGQDPAAICMQIVFATAVGFALVVLFFRGGSLIPCMVFHSVNNALSVFANDRAQADALGGKTAALIGPVVTAVILMTVYSVWNWKHLKPSK